MRLPGIVVPLSGRPSPLLVPWQLAPPQCSCLCVAPHNRIKQTRHIAQAADSHEQNFHTQPSQHQPSKQQQQQQAQEQEFWQTLAALQQLSFSEQQQLLEDQPEHKAFSASFLFWLSAQERKAVGARQQALAQLAAQLVLLKEQAEAEASRRMLPPLASSLSYSNYMQWRSTHSDADLPDVTPGVPLGDFYRAAEREEAKLKQWQAPQRPSSTLDNFAAASGYSSFAADAMARVRARLAGFDSDEPVQQPATAAGAAAAGNTGGAAVDASSHQQQQEGVSPAALRVLDELLLSCCCREERATLLPEACVPPGLEVSATGSASNSQSSSSVARVLTSPQRLLAAVSARLQQLQAQAKGTEQQEQELQETLPSGESAVQAMQELQEDIQEYDQHVYSRLSRRDLQGL